MNNTQLILLFGGFFIVVLVPLVIPRNRGKK